MVHFSRFSRGAAGAGLGCAALLASGCGTIITKIDGPKTWEGQPISYVYSGFRFSLGGAEQSEVPYVWVIDVPLSLVADTGVLPVSLLQVGYRAVSEQLFPPEQEVVLTPEATVVPPGVGEDPKK